MSIIATKKIRVKSTVTQTGNKTARVRTTVNGNGRTRTTTKTIRAK